MEETNAGLILPDRLETPISLGDSIKCLSIKGDTMTVGGRAILYGDALTKDLVGDWFSPECYFGANKGRGVDMLLHHAMPLSDELKHYADEILPPVIETTEDEHGLLYKACLNLRNGFQKRVGKMVEDGLLSTSTGALPHTVRRNLANKSAGVGEIIRWMIGEMSYTPTPCEFRLGAVMPLKSLLNDELLHESSNHVAAVKCLTDSSFSLNVPFEIQSSIPPIYGESTEEFADRAEVSDPALKWDESAHPRDKDGKFGSGGGDSNAHIAHPDHHITNDALATMDVKQAKSKLKELKQQRKANRDAILKAAHSQAPAPERQQLLDESRGLEAAMERLRVHIWAKENGVASVAALDAQKKSLTEIIPTLNNFNPQSSDDVREAQTLLSRTRQPLGWQVDGAVECLKCLHERCDELTSLKAGRVLSKSNWTELNKICQQLTALLDTHKAEEWDEGFEGQEDNTSDVKAALTPEQIAMVAYNITRARINGVKVAA